MKWVAFSISSKNKTPVKDAISWTACPISLTLFACSLLGSVIVLNFLLPFIAFITSSESKTTTLFTFSWVCSKYITLLFAPLSNLIAFDIFWFTSRTFLLFIFLPFCSNSLFILYKVSNTKASLSTKLSDVYNSFLILSSISLIENIWLLLYLSIIYCAAAIASVFFLKIILKSSDLIKNPILSISSSMLTLSNFPIY